MQFRLLDFILLISLLAIVSAGLVYGRAQALHVYGDQNAQTEWDAWREDAKDLAKGIGPVTRRVPKSAEPPALKLMRDYFAVCLGLALLLSSVLFLTSLAFVRGAFTTGKFVDRSPPELKNTSPR
ncbi:hypothetical protein ETAA8_49990 [Anatilimnocola aggregata]|uniref:Uncharacterized protein n=1 Tax=Anatilimnocola aggregata TaxID=2528021 RepID=A0A517YI24_9BACT|nr:hypothetical protein [Anatilimnocola aggregata]QDU29883.1 hypothetical protein ETAA8_49990 [Anatilimnocola aggregata]